MILTCKFWLAGCVVHHLYDVCVTVQFKFIPDPRYPQITLEIQDAMRRRGVTVCVCVVCEIWMFFVVLNVADKMKSVCARFVEMDFDLSSSSFDLLFRCWLLRSTTWCIFFFHHIDLNECLSAWLRITSNAMHSKLRVDSARSVVELLYRSACRFD
jgi:hypothetical protein